jgi:hypothetical protein
MALIKKILLAVLSVSISNVKVARVGESWKKAGQRERRHA